MEVGEQKMSWTRWRLPEALLPLSLSLSDLGFCVLCVTVPLSAGSLLSLALFVPADDCLFSLLRILGFMYRSGSMEVADWVKKRLTPEM